MKETLLEETIRAENQRTQSILNTDIVEGLMLLQYGFIPQIPSACVNFNVAQFDRLTDSGFKLDMILNGYFRT